MIERDSPIASRDGKPSGGSLETARNSASADLSLGRLPMTGGQYVPFSDIADATRAALRADEEAGRIWYARLTLIPDLADGWHSFTAMLRRRPPDDLLDEPECNLRLGPVRLVSRVVRSVDVDTPAGLLAALSPDPVRAGVRPPSAQGVYVYRERSHHRDGRGDITPFWEARWNSSSDPSTPQVPQERLFNAERSMFFPGVASAAAAWGGDDRARQKSDAETLHRIRIPDERAYFADLIAREDGLDVCAAGTHTGPLFCAGTITGADGSESSVVIELRDGRGSVAFPMPPEGLSLHLFDGAGTEYDRYESPQFSTRPGDSLYDSLAALASGPVQDLDVARQGGESDAVEFKAVVPPTRKQNDDKARELLETVVAFANTAGGTVYVGVDDYGEVVGMAGDLARWYGAETRGDEDRGRRLYVGDLRRLIAEGVRPTVSPTVGWVEAAGLLVLRLTVPKGLGGPYALAGNDAVFFRRGATNRRAARADIVAFAAESRGMRRGLLR